MSPKLRIYTDRRGRVWAACGGYQTHLSQPPPPKRLAEAVASVNATNRKNKKTGSETETLLRLIQLTDGGAGVIRFRP